MAFEEVEEVKTYSEIVVSLREELQRYMEREAERFSLDMEAINAEALRLAIITLKSFNFHHRLVYL